MIRKKFHIALFLLAAVGVLFLGINTNSQAIAAAEKPRIVAVFQVGFIDFFVPTRLGCEKAANEYGADFKFMGPPDQSVTGLISMIESVLVRGVDGLVIETIDQKSMIPTGKKIQSMGIPVVLTNELTEHEGYDGYCGADPIEVGKLQGQQLEMIMQGNGPWAKKFGYKASEVAGEVAFLSDAPGSANIEGRIKGAREYLKKFPGIKDIGQYDSTLSIEKGQEVINNILTAHPDLKAIVNAGSVPTVAAAMAVKERGLKGKVVVIGMDLLPHTLRLVQDGVVAVTIGQNPGDQGYLPVKALCEFILNKKPIPKFMPTKLEVVDLSNVDEIYKRELDFLEKAKTLSK